MTMEEAVEAARRENPQRHATARAMFEMWAGRTAGTISTCRDWDGLSGEGQAVWIDMVSLYVERPLEQAADLARGILRLAGEASQ